MFYERYVTLCKEKGVSPSRAALEMGLSKSTVTSWKKTGNIPTGENLQVISNYFNVTTDYLLGKTDDPHEIIAGPMKASIKLSAIGTPTIEKATTEVEAESDEITDELIRKNLMVAFAKEVGEPLTDDDFEAAVLFAKQLFSLKNQKK